MTTDILSDIDTALDDWGDAMRWTPHPFPSLPPHRQDTVRQICHDTGLDGYAAWLAVADVMQEGYESPFADLVWHSRETAPAAGTFTFTFDPVPGAIGYHVWSDEPLEGWTYIGYTDEPVVTLRGAPVPSSLPDLTVGFDAPISRSALASLAAALGFADEFDEYLAEQMQSPSFSAAFELAEKRYRRLRGPGPLPIDGAVYRRRRKGRRG